MELLTEPNRTSLIFGEVAATAPDAGTVLLYSHFDKQPPFNGWDADKGPYTPVIADREGSPCLYGRGGADDVYQKNTFNHCMYRVMYGQNNLNNFHRVSLPLSLLSVH